MDEEIDAAVEGDVATTDAAPDAGAAPAQPAAPQGPDWNSLGVDFNQAKERLQYFQELDQGYRSNPTWAQKYDALYKELSGQQQPQPHAYDWMNYDDDRVAKLREYGAQNPEHPDFQKHNAEINNFMYNPIGQLSQFSTHPKVVEAQWGALAPQVQDLVNRALQPIQQYMHQQGQAQFKQQYEKAYMALPPNIKQAFQKGVFGQGNQGIIHAIEFSKMTPQEQADAGVPSGGGAKPTKDNRNNASTKKVAVNDDDDDDIDAHAKALGQAMQRKK